MRRQAPRRPSARPRRGVLRPRPDPDGGLVGLPVRACGVPRRADEPPPAGRRRLGEPPLPAARRRPTTTPTRCATGSRRSLAGTGVRRPGAARRRRAGRDPAAALSADARVAHEPPGRGPAGLHRHRGLARAGRDAGPRAGASTAGSARSSPRSSTASTPAEPAGLFIYGEGKARRSASWPARGDSTWPSPTPTRTRSRICRCSQAVGHPVAVNPDRELLRIARERGLGRCCASTG